MRTPLIIQPTTSRVSACLMFVSGAVMFASLLIVGDALRLELTATIQRWMEAILR